MEIKELAYAEKSHKEYCEKLNKMAEYSKKNYYREALKRKVFVWFLFLSFLVLLICSLYKCPSIEITNKSSSGFATKMAMQSLMMKHIMRKR